MSLMVVTGWMGVSMSNLRFIYGITVIVELIVLTVHVGYAIVSATMLKAHIRECLCAAVDGGGSSDQ